MRGVREPAGSDQILAGGSSPSQVLRVLGVPCWLGVNPADEPVFAPLRPATLISSCPSPGLTGLDGYTEDFASPTLCRIVQSICAESLGHPRGILRPVTVAPTGPQI